LFVEQNGNCYVKAGALDNARDIKITGALFPNQALPGLERPDLKAL
jgi:hypothetical protein